MARLDARQRSRLPDSAFAYIDSAGKRRLPINDEPHVRNALARFSQVRFESIEARDRAFQKLLKAAVSYGIAPVGFIAAQMERARSGDRPELPRGSVAFMMTDIEGSTGLINRLGPRYAALLDEIRDLIGGAVEDADGYIVDARADEFFAVFAATGPAAETALSVQDGIDSHSWDAPVRVRIGLHCGAPARTETGYVGLEVNTVARICAAGHGGQILASADLTESIDPADGITLTQLGAFQLRGLPQTIELFQIDRVGRQKSFPPLRL